MRGWRTSGSTGQGDRGEMIAATCFEYLFAIVGDGRRWLIPSAVADGRTAIHLGGERYAQWEIDRGPPLVIAGASLH